MYSGGENKWPGVKTWQLIDSLWQREMRIRSCGYHNARAFILQSLKQVRNLYEAVIHFQQNLGILATLLPHSSLKRILNYWTHRCWVSWNVHMFGHSAVCMFEVLGANGQDGLWVLIHPFHAVWEISDFCVYFRLQEPWGFFGSLTDPSRFVLKWTDSMFNIWKMYYILGIELLIMEMTCWVLFSKVYKKSSFCKIGEICSVEVNTSMTITVPGSCAPCMEDILTYHNNHWPCFCQRISM